MTEKPSFGQPIVQLPPEAAPVVASMAGWEIVAQTVIALDTGAIDFLGLDITIDKSYMVMVERISGSSGFTT